MLLFYVVSFYGLCFFPCFVKVLGVDMGSIDVKRKSENEVCLADFCEQCGSGVWWVGYGEHQTRDPCVAQVESGSRADTEQCKDRVT